MGIKVKVKVKNNFKKFEKINNQISGVAAEGIKDVLKNIRGYAIKLEKGHNEQGILCEMIDMSTKEVKRSSVC